MDNGLRIALNPTLRGFEVSIGGAPTDKDPLGQRRNIELTFPTIDKAIDAIPDMVREALK